MNLEELLGKLPEEVKGDVSEYIGTAISAEKERGIAETQKRNVENQKLKGYLKDLGYSSDNYETISSFVEDKKAQTAEKDISLASLSEKFNELTSELEKERQIVAAKEKESYNLKLNNELNERFGNTFYAQQDIIDNLIANGKVSLDDSSNLKFGELSFEEGFKALKESKADSVKADITPGTESNGGTTPADTQMSFADAVAASTGDYGL
jgi:hypothetical protein